MKKKAVFYGLLNVFAVLSLPLIFVISEPSSMTMPLGSSKWILFLFIVIAVSFNFIMGYQLYLHDYHEQQKRINIS